MLAKAVLPVQSLMATQVFTIQTKNFQINLTLTKKLYK